MLGPGPSEGIEGKTWSWVDYVLDLQSRSIQPSWGKTQHRRNGALTYRPVRLDPCNNFAMECSSLSKTLGELGRGPFFRMFKEPLWLKQEARESNSVIAQKTQAQFPEPKSMVRTGSQGRDSRKMWVYLGFLYAKATAPLWFDLRHILKK